MMRRTRDGDVERKIGEMVIMMGDSFTLGNTVIRNSDKDSHIFQKRGSKHELSW
jgi:hypothetical protein